MAYTYKPTPRQIIACKFCNISFEARKDQLYCSGRCRALGSRAARGLSTIAPESLYAPKYCKQCGEYFDSDNLQTQYCSKQCCGRNKRANSRNTLAVCKHCNREFYQDSHKQSYCSYSCSGKVVCVAIL